MKRHIGILLCLVMLVSVLTGCMQLKSNLEFHTDGSWTCTQHAAMSEQLLASLDSLEEAKEALKSEVIDGETYYYQEEVVHGSNVSGFSIYNQQIELLNDFVVMTWVGDDNAEHIEISFTVAGGADTEKQLIEDMTESSDLDEANGLEGLTYEQLADSMEYTLTISIPYDLDVAAGDPSTLSLSGDTITVDLIPDEPLSENTLYRFTGVLSKDIVLEHTDNYFPAKRDYAGEFTDVASDAWYASAAVRAYESGFISGTTSTTFSPNNQITQAELLVMAARVRSTYMNDNYPFNSDGGDWYEPYRNYLIDQGVIYSTEFTAAGVTPATRLDMASIFSRVLPNKAYYVGGDGTSKVVPDMEPSDPAYYYVLKLYNCGIIAGVDAVGNFQPYSYLTRAEAAVILTRLAYSSTR